MPQTPARSWWARWNTGPASSAPMPPTTAATPSASSARTRIARAAPAAPSAATEAYEPMLTATSRKNRPWPVGASATGAATSVTFSGTPSRAATGVKTFSTAVAPMSDAAVATSSSGALGLGT